MRKIIGFILASMPVVLVGIVLPIVVMANWTEVFIFWGIIAAAMLLAACVVYGIHLIYGGE